MEIINNLIPTLTKRIRCDYDLLEQDIMKLRKQNILNELEILKKTGKSIIYENQEIIASNVVSVFKPWRKLTETTQLLNVAVPICVYR